MNKRFFVPLFYFVCSLNLTILAQPALLSTPPKQSRLQNPFLKSQTSFTSNLPQTVSDQTPTERNCFTVESEKKLQEKFPKRLSTNSYEEQLANRMASFTSAFGPETVYKIPTIVHIVHNGEAIGSGTNISKEQVLSQFDALNEDFRRLGAGYNEHPRGADIKIEFVPVLFDPEGNLLEEPGIDRVFGYNAFYDYYPIELELKPNTQWDPNRYFNIWVLNFGGGMTGTLGYAQFPSMSGIDGLPEDGAAETDGVVIGHRYFGRTGTVQAPFNLGRTTTHEVGHWLGLRHIWGDGDCSVDDFCADTPNASGPNHSCEFRDSCPEEGPDMIENYMDYSDDPCMNIFTLDQMARMRTVLEVSPRRNSLIGCQQATVALAGNNTSTPYMWFEYTASVQEVVTISSMDVTTVDTKLSLYKECNALPVNIIDNVRNTLQSELSITLEVGETVKILWEGDESFEDFEWNLSVSVPTTGATCEVASVAIDGVNNLPVTPLNTYWFVYTASSDNNKIRIDGSGNNFTVYGNNCTNLNVIKSGTAPFTVYDVSTGESIYIAFDAAGGNFNWSLTVDNMRVGEACSDAAAATQGKNVIPYAPPFNYWYTFTMPYNGVLSIQMAEATQGLTRLAVFKECGGIPLVDVTNTKIAPVNLSLLDGQTVKILWDGEFSIENVEWVLQTTPYTNGEICSEAKEAIVGINTAGFAPQWFKYTATGQTNLKISSVGMTEVDTHLIIKSECSGPILYDNDNSQSGNFSSQSELILHGIEAGQTFYILWSEKWSYEGFDWIIEEIEPLPGDNCGNAKQAEVGVNTVDYYSGHDNFGNIFWTKFTVPASGKKITALSSKPVDVAIYKTANCQTFTWLAEDQGKAQAFNLPAGTELLILWDGADFEEDFTWQLSVEDIMPGDVCSDPVDAVAGINTAPYTPFWYEYTMAQNGSLKITSEGLSDQTTFFAILGSCSFDNILFKNTNTAFVSGLNQGERVLIYVTIGYPFTGTSWSLEEIPVAQGDFCSDPLPATYGLNEAAYATSWYSYTVESSGNLKISSRAFTYNDTDLFVYDGCDGTLLASSDNIFSYEDFIVYFQSEVLLENVVAGQTLLIKWAGNWSFEPFTWEITNGEPRPGDSCEDPLVAVEGVNNAMKPNPSWFSFTMPSTNSLTLSSLGYAPGSTLVEIYDACNGNLLTSDTDQSGQSYVHLDELAAGQTVLIKWYNSFYASEQYTFDWRLIVGEPEPGLFCEFPAVAQTGVNIVPAYVSEYFWYTFTIPENNKKVTITRSGSSEIYRVVGLVGSCDWTQVYAIGEDRVELSGLSAGEQVLIFWGEVRTGERQGFNWELSVSDAGAGDICELPKEALPGINTTNGPPTWYKYTLPRNGNIRISSVGHTTENTNLEVYDGCTGNLIASNDNPDDYSHLQSEVLLENVEGGQSIWIKWSNVYQFQMQFNWELSIEGVQNTAPVLDDTFLQLMTSPANGQVIGTVQAIDDDNDALHYSILSGNDDGAFALAATTGVLTIADATLLTETRIVRELEVAVTDRIATAEATVSIDIITAVGSEVEALVKAFPNPATNILYLDISPAIQVHQSSLVDIYGRIVQINDPTQREISLLNLTGGVYFLKLTTSVGPCTLKISVVK